MASAGSAIPGSAGVGDREAELGCAAGCVDPLGSQRFGRKSLSQCASALVEIEGPRSRREEDQLQGVSVMAVDSRFRVRASSAQS